MRRGKRGRERAIAFEGNLKGGIGFGRCVWVLRKTANSDELFNLGGFYCKFRKIILQK